MKVFYLGFWLPQELVLRDSRLNGAGQLWESRFLSNLAKESEVRIASIVDRKLELPGAVAENPNHLLLQGRFGKELQAYPSFSRLRKKYSEWRRQGWKPDYFVVYNSHPIGNAFTRFLAEQDPCVRRILLFLDSRHFGEKLGFFKRARLKLKPLHWSDEEMLTCFHGVAAASLSSQSFCHSRNIPWLWFPGGTQADGLLDATQDPSLRGPKKIGYFGSHSDYAGLRQLIEAFMASPRMPLELSIAGDGPKTEGLKLYTASDPRIEWVGFFNERSQLGHWASGCHILANPRPAAYGNDNNFPSKVFDYIQLARVTLSSVTPTLKHAFGDSMIWYDARSPGSLDRALNHLTEKSSADLLREGAALREKYARLYSWEESVPNLTRWLRNRGAIDPG